MPLDFEGLQQLPACHVPQPHASVVTGGGEQAPIAAEGNRTNGLAVRGEREQLRAAGDIPHSDRFVDAPGGKPLSVGTEDGDLHWSRVT